jgi:hypothetical protein
MFMQVKDHLSAAPAALSTETDTVEASVSSAPHMTGRR